MDAQRQRVQEFDENNAKLDEPLATPRMKVSDDATSESAAWSYDVFLRLPLGCGVLPRDKLPYHSSFNRFPCFRYAGGDTSVSFFVAAARVADAKAKPEFGSYTPENFRVLIREAMEDYYAKTFQVRASLQAKGKPRLVDKKQVSAYPDSAPIKYEHVQLTDDGTPNVKRRSTFDVYVRGGSSRQVGIIVHQLAQQNSNNYLNQTIDACLGTLDISPEAGNKRNQFRK